MNIIRPLSASSEGGREARIWGKCSRARLQLGFGVNAAYQMPTIFPARSFAAPAISTAMQTSQLQPMAFTSVGRKSPATFLPTVATASSFAVAGRRPVYQAASTNRLQPIRLPTNEVIQDFMSSSNVTKPSKSAAGTAAALPVNSWPPVIKISRRFAGNRAAKISF